VRKKRELGGVWWLLINGIFLQNTRDRPITSVRSHRKHFPPPRNIPGLNSSTVSSKVCNSSHPNKANLEVSGARYGAGSDYCSPSQRRSGTTRKTTPRTVHSRSTPPYYPVSHSNFAPNHPPIPNWSTLPSTVSPWSSWYGPCNISGNPWLVQLYPSFYGASNVFSGVNCGPYYLPPWHYSVPALVQLVDFVDRFVRPLLRGPVTCWSVITSWCNSWCNCNCWIEFV